MSSMLSTLLWSTFIFLPTEVDSHRPRNDTLGHPSPSESVQWSNQTIRHCPVPIVPTNAVIEGMQILANTTRCTNGGSDHLQKRASNNVTTKSTFLVLARDQLSAYSAYSGLNDYGIPYEVLLVPQSGASLPTLNSSSTVGNYGGIVVLSEVSYSSGGSFVSALTASQWNTLYTYQVNFGARMVRLDVIPSSASGTKVATAGACCADTQEQFVSITDTSKFSTAGLVQGATLSTLGLYHYPATITNSSTTAAFANFGTTTGFASPTVAGVINTLSGRQQMVFFMPFATDWSLTSVVLQHAWIHWATRGLYAGYRRMMLNTQVDDMFLVTSLTDGSNLRVDKDDVAAHIPWMASINSRLPAGSNYTMEIGHNGNGNIGQSWQLSPSSCPTSPIFESTAPVTVLEYVKPLGTGTSLWPANTNTYPYTLGCVSAEPLAQFFQNASNRDAFMHVSHTFTHESENAATYSDVYKEISWNQAWLDMIGISGAKWWSGRGLIPPAITGVHNGDALRAWSDCGLKNAVGDNTRSVLLNQVNEHWPLMTTVAANGFDGIQLTPRWATNIYYNTDTADLLIPEYISLNSADPSSTLDTILAVEKSTNTRHLLSLHHDPYMFHQANLNVIGLDPITVNRISQNLSLFQAWVETVLVEVIRLVTWPIISLKHDDIAAYFAQRMVRDNCGYSMRYESSNGIINAVVVSSLGNGTGLANVCKASIPVTFPGEVGGGDADGFVSEQIGGDPLTVWVDLRGSEVRLRLRDGVAW